MWLAGPEFKAQMIQGMLANWMHNWLSDRRQMVVVDGCFPHLMYCRDRCWDLCCLQCLLNDLDENVDGIICKFADKKKIYILASKDVCLIIQQDIVESS